MAPFSGTPRWAGALTKKRITETTTGVLWAGCPSFHLTYNVKAPQENPLVWSFFWWFINRRQQSLLNHWWYGTQKYCTTTAFEQIKWRWWWKCVLTWLTTPKLISPVSQCRYFISLLDSWNFERPVSASFKIHLTQDCKNGMETTERQESEMQKLTESFLFNWYVFCWHQKLDQVPKYL